MGTAQNKLVTSHQYNKRNKQAVQVLNKVEYDSDGNPIGMMEDPYNPTSANFGTPREPIRGGCYKGDGSSYIEVIGLLSTDTVEVLDGSNVPTISDGRIDIASSDKVFGIRIYRDGSLWAKYNCSENSGDICYDSSGNGNHGTIVNAITTTPEENPNSIHQYQDVYSFEDEEGVSGIKGFKLDGVDGSKVTVPSYSYTDKDYKINVSFIYNGITTEQTIFGDSNEGGKIYMAYDSIRIRPTSNNIETIFSNLEVNKLYSLDVESIGNTDKVYINGVLRYQRSNDSIFESGIKSIGSLAADVRFVSTLLFVNFQLFDIQSNSVFCQYTGKGDESELFDLAGTNNAAITPNGVVEYLDSQLLIPKDSSITLPPFKDVLGNNLQYVGKVPGKAKFVDSSCFLSDGNAYLSVDILTTDTITAHSKSEVPVCTTDGRLDFPVVGGKYFGITVERSGSVIAKLPLCEPIIDPSTHIYHDVSGKGNHATLMNGTLANNGNQDKFHYLQKGFNFAKIGANRLPYTDDVLSYWSLSPYAEILETGLPDPLGGNKAIRIKYQTSNYHLHRSVIYKALTRPYPGAGSPRGNYTISLYVKNAIPGELNSFRLNIRLSQLSPDLVAGDSWNRFSFYGNHNVDSYQGNGLSNDSLDSSFDLIIFGFQMELGNNLSPYEPTMFIGRSDGYKPVRLDNGRDAEMNESIITPQDGKSFLNTGTRLEAYDYPALRQADEGQNFWYDKNGNPRNIEFGRFKSENPINAKYYFGKNQYSTDDNIIGLTNLATYLTSLKPTQNFMEKIVRNVFEISSSWLLKDGYWDNSGVWDNSAYFNIK